MLLFGPIVSIPLLQVPATARAILLPLPTTATPPPTPTPTTHTRATTHPSPTGGMCGRQQGAWCPPTPRQSAKLHFRPLVCLPATALCSIGNKAMGTQETGFHSIRTCPTRPFPQLRSVGPRSLFKMRFKNMTRRRKTKRYSLLVKETNSSENTTR
jgi:hypothetical protein